MIASPNRPHRVRLLVAASASAIAAAGLWASALSAQQDPEPITRPAAVGTPVADSLPADAVHAFTLDLAGDRFVRGAVEQTSVDVVVTILGPDGQRVARYDGPAAGPEHFVFDAKEPGTYRIEVAPFEDGSGRYEFSVTVEEALAADPAARVDQLMAVFDVAESPGAVIGVVRDGELAFARGYGRANLTHDIPFSTETRTNIGSTAKQFTAFAIHLLAERGDLSLDDDVREHIPELKDFGETITIRHLLTHTSGYREFLNLLAMGGRRLDYDYVDRGELIEIVERQPELQNAPGAEWNYNNTGYGLLADIVSRVGGMPFPEWMRENVFLPLGMEHTMVRTDPRTIVPHSAMGYVAGDEGHKEAADLGGAMGAGGIYTTVGDLARWMTNYFDPALGDHEIVDAMTTPFVLTDGDTTNYGHGLFLDEFRGLDRVHHGGADVAHRSTFVMFPELEGGIIVLSNLASFPGQLANEVVEAFFSDALDGGDGEAAAVAVADEGADDSDAADGTEASAADSPAAAYDPADFDPETFDAYAGRYSMEEMPAFVLSFRRDGDRYYTQATGQPEVEIAPVSDSTFKVLVVDARVTFHREDDGSVRRITLHQNGDHPATRVEADPLTEAQLAAYTGRYFSEELDAYWEVVARDGGLVATHRRLDDVELNPVANAEDAFSGAFPFARLDFERSDEGEVTGFRGANGRTRDVWFAKIGDGEAME